MKPRKFIGISLEKLHEEAKARAAIRRVIEIDERRKREKSILLSSLMAERERIIGEIRQLQSRLLRIGTLNAADRPAEPDLGPKDYSDLYALSASSLEVDMRRKTRKMFYGGASGYL